MRGREGGSNPLPVTVSVQVQQDKGRDKLITETAMLSWTVFTGAHCYHTIPFAFLSTIDTAMYVPNTIAVTK
jgi:hypothetical protein